MDLAARVEQLEAENAYLREELGLASTDGDIKRLVAGAGLTPSLAAVVLCLFKRRDRPMPNHLYEEVWPPKDHVRGREYQKSLHVAVCKIRKIMGRDMIVTIWGRGVVLSAEGRFRVAEILGVAP